eukprot:2896494-Alexandrium_andersonii.AAC.1
MAVEGESGQLPAEWLFPPSFLRLPQAHTLPRGAGRSRETGSAGPASGLSTPLPHSGLTTPASLGLRSGLT